MPAPDFTRIGYQELIRGVLERGYEIRDFQTAEPDSRHLILRHDIDHSIDAAVRIAEIEAERGWPAVYFVRVHTEFYDLHSPAELGGLRRLLALGHQVGLHFDHRPYVAQSIEIDRAAANECEILETMLGRRVTDISLHSPRPPFPDRPAGLAGRRHAYQQRFVADMGYCSDSRGEWRHGHPLDHPAVVAGRALHLLTHPIWWQGQEPVSAAAREDLVRAERDEMSRAVLGVPPRSRRPVHATDKVRSR